METSKFLKCVLVTSLLSLSNLGYAEECGDVYDIGVGPWDYANPINHQKGSTTGNKFKSKVHLVESIHFTSDVRNLIRGATSKAIMPDLAYTLGKFPNHYPALFSLIKYDKLLKGQLPQLKNKTFPQTVSCYFTRALQFKPEDYNLHHLYGIYLHMNARYKEAISRYQFADKKMDSPELDYNMGLSYFEDGDYENAKKYAMKAYQQNYPLPALKVKLKSKGFELTD